MKKKRLTDQEKIHLAELWQSGEYSIKQLSAEFGISDVAIRGLLKRRGYEMLSKSECQKFKPAGIDIQPSLYDERSLEQMKGCEFIVTSRKILGYIKGMINDDTVIIIVKYDPAGYRENVKVMAVPKSKIKISR